LPDEPPLSINTERVDDIPLLFSIQKQLGICQILDEVVPVHGNREGLSIGRLTTTWLSYILSEADHRMCEVESWAASHQLTLTSLLDGDVNPKDFTDDRLADVLRYLSDDATWVQIEAQLGRRFLRVYDLNEKPIRLDSTTVAGYHDTKETDLFRFGHSKDHRPDLPQFKVMLATLDPLGMPLATLTVAGNEADDGLYLPAIDAARKVVGCGGRLYIGDAKLSAVHNRATIDKTGDYYLTPLAMSGEIPELKARLIDEFHRRQHPIEIVRQSDIDALNSSSTVPVALGFEVDRMQKAKIDGQSHTWLERVMVIYSPTLARTSRQGLSKRLARAEKELSALTLPPKSGRRRFESQEALAEKVQEILTEHRVEGLFDIEYQKEEQRRYVRAYKQKPPRYLVEHRYVIRFKRAPLAIGNERKRMGFRLYATNAPKSHLPFARSVEVYRASPTIERNFARLKGKSLGIRPMYVHREDHVIGMVRLLSLALRVLTTVEYIVRQRLMRLDKPLAGLYAGNPRRQTQRPTTERLLQAFNGITLTEVTKASGCLKHLTPLTPLQKRILRLLGLSTTLYLKLTGPDSAMTKKSDDPQLLTGGP
jgi:transposase